MNEEQQAMVSAIKAELERQSQLPHQGAVSLYNDDGDATIGVDGVLDMQALADAMLSAFSKYHLMG